MAGGSITTSGSGSAGIFLDTRSGSGSVSITTTGNTAITTNTGADGIAAETFSGSATISSNALIGSFANPAGTGLLGRVGISPTFVANPSATGNLMITQTGGSILANTGIFAQNNGIGAISVVTFGNITSLDGRAINATSTGGRKCQCRHGGWKCGSWDFRIFCDKCDNIER
jgi:hypothetical protein